jgi:hypothetical protein
VPGSLSSSSECVSFQSRKRARKERLEVLIIRVQGCGKQGERTGDGRVRSESWHVFWIGSERLSEIEHYLHISACGGCNDARAGAERREDEKRRVIKVEP